MKLAVEPKVFKDESLISWLIRSSIANGSDPKSFYLALFDKYKAWNNDIDRYLPQVQTQQLSKLTSLDQHQIHNLTLEPYIEKISDKEKLDKFSFWYFVIPTGRRGLSSVSGMHFCPECLKASTPYLKMQWRLSWNIGCTTHKIRLLNRCQKCNSVFSPQQLDYEKPYLYLCASCGFDLRNSEIESADKVALSFQETLNDILFNGKTISFPALKTMSIGDLFITIRTFISFFQYAYKIKKYAVFFETVNLDISYFENNKVVHVFEKMSVEHREYFLKTLCHFLQSDVDVIKELLHQSGATHKVLQGKMRTLSPTVLYLSKNLKDPKNYVTQGSKQDIVRPNNKDEVNRLYRELLRYL